MPTAVERILAQAETRPEQKATQTATYGELCRKARALAARLQEEAGPVAVLSQRHNGVLAFLAVLFSGRSYLPINLDLPPQRLEEIFSLASPGSTLCEPGLEGLLPQKIAHQVSLDEEVDPGAWRQGKGGGYTFFTSGSTNIAKGVVVGGHSLDSYADALLELFEPEPGQIYLHTASFAFSASIRQLLLPLTSGGRIVVANQNILGSPRDILDAAFEAGVEVIDTVPSVLSRFCRALRKEPSLLPPRLKRVCVTGEPLNWSVAREWTEVAPEVELYNLYSQTETAGTVCAYRVRELQEQGTVPLGSGLPDVQIEIREDEILVRSPRLAVSYLSQDGEVPLAPEGYYPTGDLARSGPEGELRYIGRRDRRVKLRGYRVSLDVVETALRGDFQVSEAVVWVDEGLQSLVAELVPASEEFSVSELRARLGVTLAPYMIPTRFQLRHKLARNSNGKLILPGSATRRMIEVWQDVMGMEGLSEGSDFFEHGGNSLVAVDLMAAVEDAFGVRLNPSEIFDTSTPALMARRLRSTDDPRASALEIQRGLPGGPQLVFVHVGWGHLDQLRGLARALGPGYAVRALKALGPDEFEQVDSVEKLAGRYLEQLQAQQPEGPYFLAGYSFSGMVAYEMAQQLQRAGQAVSLVAMLDTYAPELREHQTEVKSLRLRQNFEALIKMSPEKRLSFIKERFLKLLPTRQRLERQKQQNSDEAEMMRTVYRLYQLLGDSYKPQPYSGEVLFFECEQATRKVTETTARGWSDLVTGQLNLVRVPGDHSGIFRAEPCRIMADELIKRLEEMGRGRDQEEWQRFVRETRARLNQPGLGRPAWNQVVSADAVRHYVRGTGDDNPHWQGSVPPGFLASIQYPVVHGAPIPLASSTLITEVGMEWIEPLERGDTVVGDPRLVEVDEQLDQLGRLRVYLTTDTTYTRDGSEVARARVKLVEVPLSDGLLTEREPTLYSEEELRSLSAELELPPERGGPELDQLEPGGTVYTSLRPPFTVSDLVGWQTAIGASYGVGAPGFRELLQNPHRKVIHPQIGWPTHKSSQHEDPNLSPGRGMPLPFDNGIMRFCLAMPTLTDWMGPDGFLSSLHLRVARPLLLGDLCRYTLEVVEVEREERCRVTLKVTGRNQLDQVVSSGTGVVVF